MMSLKGDICNVVISGTQLWPICCSKLLFFFLQGGDNQKEGGLKGTWEELKRFNSDKE